MNALASIKEYIVSIGEFFSSIFDFVIGIFEDIAYVVKLTAEFVVKIPDYFSWLPPELVALIVTIFGVVVIYKVLGREG